MCRELLFHYRNFHQEPLEDLFFLHCCVNVALGCFCSGGSLECFAVPIIDSVNALSVFKSAAVS